MQYKSQCGAGGGDDGRGKCNGKSSSSGIIVVRRRSHRRCEGDQLWRWPLVALALTVVVLSQSVSSTVTIPVSNDLINAPSQHPINTEDHTAAAAAVANAAAAEADNNETSAAVLRDFAAGIATSDGVNLTSEFQDQHDARRVDTLRERNRQQRIVSIQKTILEKLGLFQTPNITNPHHVNDDYIKRMAKVFELLQTRRPDVQGTESEDVYAKRVQSFYPSCSLPRNMDRDLWGDVNLFHIYYEIPVPQLPEGTSTTVSSAKLRLYKMAPTPDNSVTSTLSTVAVRSDRATASTPDTTSSLSCDERFRITVFQYTKPLKKTKKVIKRKRKLIDSRMVAVDFEGWLEFDVRLSARDWLENSSRNLGLEIELEDSMANTHNPSEFLRNMNCSEANDPPFPRFMEDRMKGHIADEDATALFENETYPTLDLKTVEIEDPVDVIPKSSKDIRQPNVVRTLHKRHVVNHICGVTYTLDNDEEYGENSNCCKKDVFVSFSDFEGGDRILEPIGFYTKTCIGRCNSIKGEEYVCAPKIKSGIDVIVLDDNDNRVKVNLPDLVTKSCSCQPKWPHVQQAAIPTTAAALTTDDY